MQPRCPLFGNKKVVCRVKEDSRHRWVGTEKAWYIQNYCDTDYHVDCEDYEAFLEQQAIVKGKILVIDDEKLWLETLNNFFSNRGYQMMTAASAEAALELIKKEQPVLALIDIKLPGMNGIELLKIIKEDFPLIKTFVITAYDEENKKTVEEIGCDAFFAKPIGLGDLKKRIVDVLSSSERNIGTLVKSKVIQGVPAAKLLFVIEVFANEEDRLSAYLRQCFTDRSQCGGEYRVDFAHTIHETTEKLISFSPDLVVINFDTLYEIDCAKLASMVVESPYKPKEVIVYGLNLEAHDKAEMEEIGVQYVDQRRTFAKLVTSIKQTSLRHGLKAEG